MHRQQGPLPGPFTARLARILAETDWRERSRVHLAAVRPWTRAFRRRKSEHHSHPVHDFLFTYYSHRASQLETWHPGAGTGLTIEKRTSGPACRRHSRYTVNGTLLFADPEKASPADRARIQWIRDFLIAVENRPPRFGCAGLHEWAMLYHSQPRERRHASCPLRLSENQISEVVDSATLCCTHFDAVRFFTEAARPLNTVQPDKENREQFEQGGCLHANMDLYKWAYKMTPWICSDLVRETFLLALDGRELDMRASPYDLREFGYDPIPIETPGGRARYEREQRALAARTEPVRRKLIEAANRILAFLGANPSAGAAVRT